MRQDQFNTPLSEVTDFTRAGQHYHFTTAEANVQLIVYAQGIIRIRVLGQGRSWEEHSYAVIENPKPTEHRFTETPTGWLLETSLLQLHIQRNPLRLELCNQLGETLVCDDPAFGISLLGTSLSCYKKLDPNEKFIGLGEKTGNLNRRGQAYEHWNTDAFAYGEESDPLYLSTPFYMGVHDSGVYGIFLDNSYRSVFNFGASNQRFSSFTVPDGELDYYMFASGSVAAILRDYSWLTGTMPLPPKWSLGYQQCRYSYTSDKQVLQLARNFRDKGLPCDVIYLDIHYMDAYKVFSWHKQNFQQPQSLVDQLKEMGFELVLIIDPGIKDEAGYSSREELLAKQLYVAYPDGTPYTGEVWPGVCLFPDFTKPATRAWWGEKFQANIDLGITGYWNDMNEPTSWGKRMPDLLEFDYDGHGATHVKAHNQYGLQMARATYEGVKARSQGKRPFVLTRAGFSGIQRYAAVWTGDNVSNNEHMLLGVRLMSSMGLAGIAFSGMDIGGFVGEADAALFARWMQIGAFSPLFRGHSMINSRDAEPWSFGESTLEISANFMRLRYRLMPYIYSMMSEAHQNGLPLVRSLAIDYTHDPHIYDNCWSNQYMFGSQLLVAAVDARQPIHKVYLPEGEWQLLYNNQRFTGRQTIYLDTPLEILPVFVKTGSVLPVLSKAPNSQKEDSPAELCLHLFAGGETTIFRLYDDDGQSFGFENGDYLERIIQYNPLKNQLEIGQINGSYPGSWRNFKLYFHGCSPIKVELNGKSLQIHRETHRFISPISNFDPFQKLSDFEYEHKNISWVIFDWQEEVQIIDYSC